MASSFIELEGVRVHNLRGVSVRIPHCKLTVISGVSGSGKSSLAFDTLYAEGRRRYVECLSTYARQFLERAARPELDRADNLPPALAIERKPPAHQARSTVGTTTEVHDYLRLLFARIGRTHCLGCGREVSVQTVDSIADGLTQRGGQGLVCFEAEVEPLSAGRDGWQHLVERLRRQGFVRLWQQGRVMALEEAQPAQGRVQVIVDRLRFEKAARSRIAEALETAYRFGQERCVVRHDEAGEERFSRLLHCPDCDQSYRPPQPRLFSANSPLGACPACRGFGRTIEPDMERIVPDPALTLAERPIDPWNKPSYQDAYADLKRAGRKTGLPWNVPYRELSLTQRELIELGGHGFYGIRGFFDFLEKKTYKVHVRVFLSRYRAFVPCLQCAGRGLRAEALAVKVDGCDIAEVASWTVERSRRWVEGLAQAGAGGPVGAPVLTELERRLLFLDEVGLGYITLDRQSRTLSGGEAQRIQLARCLGGGLVGTLYVLDEPSVGLHPQEVDQLVSVLQRLRDLGNTVVMVEHDPRVIAAADYLIDLGPGAGERGGQVLYQGAVADVARCPRSLTGAYLRGRNVVSWLTITRTPGARGWLVLENARTHNLRDITVRFPKQALSVVTGVSGSGKSSLVRDTLYGALSRRLGGKRVPVGPCGGLRGVEGLQGVELVDQSPIGRSPRSNPATYVKAFEGIRRLLAATPAARARGLRPGFFSFNLAGGRCESCEGAGVVKVEMHFLADMLVACEACGGRRFGLTALEVRYRDKNVAEILDLTVTESLKLFRDDRAVASRLELLEEIGLGYVRLGQPAPTLSGGESQRLKLVAHLKSEATSPRVLLLDEPTTGLHLHDLAMLIRLLRKLVNAGHTLVVVEHHLELIRAADWVIDLGPGAGAEGGCLMAEGTPEEVARTRSATGRYLGSSLHINTEPTSNPNQQLTSVDVKT